MPREVRRTTCNRDCPDACAILATVETADPGDPVAGGLASGGTARERVVKLGGDPTHPVTQGFLCQRTNLFLERQYSPERLTTPLLRKGGALTPVGWDEALDHVATALLRIRSESGPAAIFHYRSGGTLGLLQALTDHLFSLFGPVTVKRGDICGGAGEAAQVLDFGVSDSSHLDDLEHARSIVLWGKNVVVSSPHLVPRLKAARARGATLILVDPVHHATARLCQRFVQPRPGADFALAMAVAALLLDRGWVPPDAARWCANLAEFTALVRGHTAEAWAAQADVPLADVEALAQALGPGSPCTLMVGWGLGRRGNGGATVRAIDALGALSGNVGVPGGSVSFYFRRRGAFELGFVHGDRTPPRSISEPLFGPSVLTAREPPIRALWVTAGNPVAMLPDSAAVAEAVRTRELSVVVDSFLTDTAALATVVLPTTTLLEDDDLLGAYGHHYLATSRPVVAPPAGVRSDVAIAQALAERVGLGPALAGTPAEWKARLIADKLAPHGITVATLDAGPVHNPLAEPVLFAGRRFPTADGRAQLLAEAAPPPAAPTATFPLLLAALSTLRAQSSQWSVDPGPHMSVTVHPDAAGAIAHGALCRLESATGALTVRLLHDPTQRRDVALAAKGGHHGRGHALNALVPAALTDLGEGGALYDTPVRVVPLPG